MKYVLFDLDGTLLGLDFDKFSKVYFLSLYKACFAQENIPLQKSIQDIMLSLKDMASHPIENKSNMEQFYHYFYQKNEISNPKSFEEKNLIYYKGEGFDVCKSEVTTQPYMQKAVALLKEKGYKIAICTNPVFPADAIKKRILWAGFNLEDFEFVTYAEKTHFIKPNPLYYQEILDSYLKCDPQEVFMVGNDVEEDMVATKVGFHVYLVKDYLISRHGLETKISLQGSSEDFYRYVKENL